MAPSLVKQHLEVSVCRIVFEALREPCASPALGHRAHMGHTVTLLSMIITESYNYQLL